jgi:hypothetical protein
MITGRRAMLLGLALGGVACHHAPLGTGHRDVVGADTTVRGIVRVAGATPFLQVVIRPGDAGSGIGVLGSLREEIGSLDGNEISVTGLPVAGQPPIPPRAIDVRSYEILAAGGVPARSGRLVQHGDAFWLVSPRDSVELQSPVPPGMVALVGQRVFVGGVGREGRLAPQVFGVIGGNRTPAK